MLERHVYFLRPIGGGKIKIGSSIYPPSRLATFMAWSPEPLEIVARAPGTEVMEHRIHRRFRAHRSHSEWFYPADEVLRFVEEVKRTGQIPDLGNSGVTFVVPNGMYLDCLLNALLKKHGLAVKDIAEFCGITVPAVKAWFSKFPVRRTPDVIDFFASRGITVTPTDFLALLTDAQHWRRFRAREQARANSKKARAA